MPSSRFYDENRFRNYPFAGLTTGHELGAGLSQLPLATIVDASVYFGPYTQFDYLTDSVWLQSVTRIGSSLRFLWQTNGVDTGTQIAIDVPISTAQFSRAYGQAASTDSQLCGATPSWEIYFTVGDLAALAALLPNENNSLVGTGLQKLEPARITAMTQLAVTSLSLYNSDRTRYVDDRSDCVDPEGGFEPQPVYAAQACVDGELVLQDGYNFVTSFDVDTNAIRFSAVLGGGSGEVCEQLPLAPDETPPAGRSTLDGGLRCSEAFRSVNGLTGRLIGVTAGPGVTLTLLPSDNRLIVDFDGNGLAQTLPG